ncbi:MAG: thioredoxin family protein [Planctomycetota bacterium]
MQTRKVPLLTVLALAVLVARPLLAQEGGEKPKVVKLEGAPKKAPEIYDTKADAKQTIADAVGRAARDNKRVLVMFGGNWCGWCHKLHALFQSDAAIRKLLHDEYELVMVDIGQWNKHMELAAGYGADLKNHGVPYLTVLDATGHVVTNQDTGSLEKDGGHDPEKVRGFLDTNKAPMADAHAVLAAAQKRAEADGKRLFLHFGAPWCGWCHRLEDFLALPEIAAIVAKDYVDVKIDEDRMVDGKKVEAEIRKDRGGGIPWILIAEPDLKELITSDDETQKGPNKNIGYPSSESERAHFMKMIAATRRNMTDEDVATLRRVLDERAAEIEAASRRAREEAEARRAKAKEAADKH